MQCEHLQVNLDRSVPLGLFTSEFVVNSLKHAFPVIAHLGLKAAAI